MLTMHLPGFRLAQTLAWSFYLLRKQVTKSIVRSLQVSLYTICCAVMQSECFISTLTMLQDGILLQVCSDNSGWTETTSPLDLGIRVLNINVHVDCQRP